MLEKILVLATFLKTWETWVQMICRKTSQLVQPSAVLTLIAETNSMINLIIAIAAESAKPSRSSPSAKMTMIAGISIMATRNGIVTISKNAKKRRKNAKTTRNALIGEVQGISAPPMANADIEIIFIKRITFYL